MTRVAIAGAAGRMGRMLVQCGHEMAGIEVTGATEIAGHASLGSDAGELAGVGALGAALTDSVAEALSNADTLIDFTFHTAVAANATAAAAAGKSLIIGTTGLTDDETATVREASGTVPIVWAPNMSLGVNLLFALAKRAAAILGADYDAEIVEVHHRHKKDAPSGTALRLGEKVAAGREQDFDAVTVYGREGVVGERPAGEIGIHAVRAGDVVGEHTLTFATDGERVQLGHCASSRAAFANGALKAAIWLEGRNPGLYDMQDVLGLAGD